MSKGSASDGVVFHAGFPNAAEDGKFGSLSLDYLIVRHRASTYFWQLEQDVAEFQWQKGDVVVVDRAMTPREGATVVVVTDDEFVLARFGASSLQRFDGESLDDGAVLWGVVTYVIHKL